MLMQYSHSSEAVLVQPQTDICLQDSLTRVTAVSVPPDPSNGDLPKRWLPWVPPGR